MSVKELVAAAVLAGLTSSPAIAQSAGGGKVGIGGSLEIEAQAEDVNVVVIGEEAIGTVNVGAIGNNVEIAEDAEITATVEDVNLVVIGKDVCGSVNIGTVGIEDCNQ